MPVHPESELRNLKSLWKHFADAVGSELGQDPYRWATASNTDVFVETIRRLDDHMAQFLDPLEMGVYHKIKILLARYKVPLVTTVGFYPGAPPQEEFEPSCYQDVFGVLEPEIERLVSEELTHTNNETADVAEGTTVKSVDDSPQRPAAASRALKAPSRKAIAAYRLFFLRGGTQVAIAAELTSEFGGPISQGQVSRWIKQVEAWLKAGNVLPDFIEPPPKPIAVDPRIIDMGVRRDHRATHQRAKQKLDE